MPTTSSATSSGSCACCSGQSGSGSGTAGEQIFLPCCPFPFPFSFFVVVSSACAQINGMVIRIDFDGVDSWCGSAETLCASCHTLRICIRCRGGVFQYIDGDTIVFSGSVPNPTPPPTDLNCVTVGIPFGCANAISFDCATMTGSITYCVATIGDQVNQAACCSAGPGPTILSIHT